MSQETANFELILIIGEINIPYKIKNLNENIISILSKKKFGKIFSTGSIGSKETLDWVTNLCKENSSKNLHIVKSESDEDSIYPENKVIKLGNFNIGIINGYQITPWDDIEELQTIQKSLEADIMISGFTNKLHIRNYNGVYFLNPGSLSGAFSPLSNDSNPSFMILMVDGDVAILYTYIYNLSLKNFEISKLEINKLKNEE